MRLKRILEAALCCVVLSSCAGHSSPVSGSSEVPDGYYRVVKGDTLYQISRRFNQNVQTLSRWNRLSDPDNLEVGQLLKVKADGNGKNIEKTKTPTSQSTASAANTDTKEHANAQYQWPVRGQILASFNGTTQKGIDIGGTRGTPIHAAAAGTVLYAGDGVRGYGKLILLRHSKTALTAYAHNDSLSVKKGQVVKAGDVIATMGSSGTQNVKLHFEIRLNGNAVNPVNYLP